MRDRTCSSPRVGTEESPGNKRQKVERRSTPPLSPAIASHNGAQNVTFCSGDQGILGQQSDADPKVEGKTRTHPNTTHGQVENDGILMAQTRTSPQGDKFAVANI